MKSRVNTVSAVMATNLLILDMLRAMPDLEAFQASEEAEVRRIEAMEEGEEQDRAVARLIEQSNALVAAGKQISGR